MELLHDRNFLIKNKSYITSILEGKSSSSNISKNTMSIQLMNMFSFYSLRILKFNNVHLQCANKDTNAKVINYEN